jgi:UDP-glucose 4-epimerase
MYSPVHLQSTVDSLLSHEHTVTVFDNLSTGKKEHLSKKISFIKGSILNTTALNKVFEESKPDAVVHLAALKAAGESMVDGVSYSDTNIIGTINVLKAMIKYKVQHIVFSSTAATYGEPQYLPLDEELCNFFRFPNAVSKIIGMRF